MSNDSTPPPPVHPANNLKERRELAGLNQDELGALLVPPISAQMIAHLENGRRELHYEYRAKLAKILNCNPDDFFSEKVDTMKQKDNSTNQDADAQRGYTPPSFDLTPPTFATPLLPQGQTLPLGRKLVITIELK